MKIEAYKCDACNNVTEEKDIVGVSAQPDMFNISLSFPTISDPAKAHIHYCLPCYDLRVLVPARSETKNETDYALRIKERAYLLRAHAVNMYNRRKNKRRK